MFRMRMETERLSLEELANISRALRSGCFACIEKRVPEPCRHPDEVRRFLEAVADAVDRDREERLRRERMRALAVDPETGEWGAGA